MNDCMKALRRHVALYDPAYSFANILTIFVGLLIRTVFDNGYGFFLAEAAILSATAMKPIRPATLLLQRTMMLIGFIAAAALFPKLLKLACANPDIWAWLFMTSAFAVWWTLIFALNLNNADKVDDGTRKLRGKKLSAYLLICLVIYSGAHFLIGVYKRSHSALIPTTGPEAFGALQALTWKLNMTENAALIGSLVLFCYFSRRVMREVCPEIKADGSR